MKILSIFGTRPEAIKMAPVVRELVRRGSAIHSRVLVTAQHRQMLDQVLSLFEIVPDYDLDLMQAGQSPTQVAASILTRLDPILKEEKPDWVLVQGDTTTVMAAAIAAFYQRIKVGHVEAGLRSFDKWQPFPEEINRRIAGVTADLHFAPTDGSRNNLLREGVPAENIRVTGNPVIDALQWVAQLPYQWDDSILPAACIEDKQLILVTAHRRENFGEPIEQICQALLEIARRYSEQVHILYPVHLNPNIQEPVYRILGGVDNITLTAPLDYLEFVQMLKASYCVLTDSGGIQEEAPGLGKPVLVLREVTERPEAVQAGTVRLVGANRQRIVSETSRLLEDPLAYQEMSQAVNPYGDGRAAQRTVGALLREKIEPFATTN